MTCYFFPGWGWYLTEVEAELRLVFWWTTIFQRCVSESSITSLEMIDDPSPHFESGSSTTQSQTFKQKLWCCEEFSSQPSIDAKIFLFIDNEKEIVDQLKYFSSLDEFFWQKNWGMGFFPKIEIWGGVKNDQNREKMGGSALPFGGQLYYGKSGRSEGTPPPKLQNWHGNKLEKRTWLGTTMEAFQWQTSYTNY